MPEQSSPHYPARRGGGRVNTLRRPSGVCFLFAKLLDDATEEILSQTQYTCRGVDTGTQFGGVTDDEGILLHEFLPDDKYDVTAAGGRELTEVYYMHEESRYAEKPWFLRLRGAEKGA